MVKGRVWFPFCLPLLGSLWGCGTVPLSAPPVSAPLFMPTPEDITRVTTLASELDTMAIECAAADACDDEVYFSRALVSLFENREAARVSFEQVMRRHPASPLAVSSALWLQLLKDEGLSAPSNDDPQRRILTELTGHWVREWMTRQLTVRVNYGRTGGLPKPAIVQSLHKQVQERDRRIADLRSQLDALKVIDQDQGDRHRRMRPPASLVPKIENHR